jgi:Fe2+ transport system protein B
METILIIGKENSGKPMLAANLTGRTPRSANFRGSTVACETYSDGQYQFVDTPGILLQSDSQTTQTVLAQLQAHEQVLLVAKSTHLDEELNDLLPLVVGKQGAIALTFWDKVQDTAKEKNVSEGLGAALGVPVIAVDARKVGADERMRLVSALEEAAPFKQKSIPWRIGLQIEPAPGPLDWPFVGTLLALFLLLVPAGLAVWAANSFAALIEPLVKGILEPLLPWSSRLPGLLAEILSGNYGILTMGPLMFVWAVPTVVAYAFIIATYKASGLAERITAALHPLVRPVGLTGRDLLRVMMGFGCNVPAVISTRACSACTRGSTIAAIAFGAACSYQFGATLAVFGAAGRPALIWPYLFVLVGSTLLYTRLTSPKEARSALNVLMIERRNFLEWPSPKSIGRDMRLTLGQFFGTALPIFFAITLLASLLKGLGVLDAVSQFLTPVMALFRLPAEAALPVVLASIRKDGLLLLAEPGLADTLTALQLLTAVYLGGVLLPCLVTALTIAREQSIRLALKLMVRQAFAAVVFSLLLAWGGDWLFG